MAASSLPADAAASAARGRRGAPFAAGVTLDLTRFNDVSRAPFARARGARALFSSQGPFSTFHQPFAGVSAIEGGVACARKDVGGVAAYVTKTATALISTAACALASTARSARARFSSQGPFSTFHQPFAGVSAIEGGVACAREDVGGVAACVAKAATTIISTAACALASTARDARARFSSQGPFSTFHQPFAGVSAIEGGVACAREDVGGVAARVAKAATTIISTAACELASTARDARSLFSSQGPFSTFHHPFAGVSAIEGCVACAREGVDGVASHGIETATTIISAALSYGYLYL